MHRDNKCLKVADWMAGHSEILFLRKMRRWVKANNKYLPEWQFCQGKELPTCYVRQIWEFWNFYRRTTLPCNQQHRCPFHQKEFLKTFPYVFRFANISSTYPVDTTLWWLTWWPTWWSTWRWTRWPTWGPTKKNWPTWSWTIGHGGRHGGRQGGQHCGQQ